MENKKYTLTEETSEVLNLAYRSYMQDGKIPPKVNVGAFLIKDGLLYATK